MSILCLQLIEPSAKNPTVRFYAGREFVGIGSSPIYFALQPHENYHPVYQWMYLHYAEGRQKDVMWAFYMRACRYTGHLDKIQDVARVMCQMLRCGTPQEWEEILRDWLVWPNEDCLR